MQIYAYLNEMLILFLSLNLVKYNCALYSSIILSTKTPNQLYRNNNNNTAYIKYYVILRPFLVEITYKYWAVNIYLND